MNERLLTSAIGVALVVVVASHLAPSIWWSEEPQPARSARVAAAAQRRSDAAFAAMDLRSGEVDPIRVGSIPSQTKASVAPRDLSVAVVVKAEKTVAISAEINARIVAMPLREGDRFKAGTKLVEFDCRRTRAELAAANAALNLHRNAHETARQLQKMGAAGVYAVKQAQFEMEKASAEAESLKAKEATCVIAAPFDGVVAERMVATHEVVAPNQPLMRIVGTDVPDLQAIVPSEWIDRLSPEQTFEVELDETHRRYPARVTSISGAVDPVSRTVRVLARFDGHPADVSPGMSGTARFADPGRRP